MTVHAQQAAAVQAARGEAGDDGGQVHVMGTPDRTDEMRRADEFVCTTSEPFDGDRHAAAAVVYHPETRAAGDAYVCAACGELAAGSDHGAA